MTGPGIEFSALSLVEKTIDLTKALCNGTKDFLWPKDIHINNRLQCIRQSIISAPHPPRRINAEALSLILRDLLSLHNNTPNLLYERMITDAIEALIQIEANSSPAFFNGDYLYIKGMKAIDICCHPCLELTVDNTMFNQLMRQLHHANKVTFHLTDRRCHTMIINKTIGLGVDKAITNKIKFKKVNKLTKNPIYIYHFEGEQTGFIGKFHPEGTITENGHLTPRAQIPLDWGQHIDTQKLNGYIKELGKLSCQTKY